MKENSEKGYAAKVPNQRLHDGRKKVVPATSQWVVRVPPKTKTKKQNKKNKNKNKNKTS